MFWGVTLETGKRYSQRVEESYHLTMAALEPPTDNKKASKYVSVMVEHDKSDYMVCTLEPNRNLQVHLDLMFVEGEEVTYYLSGEGTVHLTGYLVGEPYDDFGDDEEDEDEESSDEEVETNGLLPKNNKRKNEALESSTESTGKKPKVDAKVANKDSKVIESDVKNKDNKKNKDLISNQKNKIDTKVSKIEDSDEDSGEDEESDDSEVNGEAIGLIDSEAAVDGGDSDDDEDEEEEDEESDESGEEEAPKSSPIQQQKGKQQNQKQQNQQKPAQNQFNNQKTPQSQQNKQQKQFGSGGPKGGFGSQQKQGFQQQKGNWNQSQSGGKGQNQNQRGGNQNWNNKNQRPGSQNNSPNFGGKGANNRSPNFKGPQKGNMNQSPKFNNSGQKEQTEQKPVVKIRKLTGGLVIEDVVEGNGPNARPGKFVHVNYVGTLPNNKVFDKTNNKPFSFRLGRGEVIKGWDIGLQDMKVGGKRKIIVPPNMGYGNRSMGPIPANSTLQFEVELKSVT